ncbi:MAG: hypothetical protein JNL70_22505 [Saprospiraceae bacterium]|nr:hypothetical protein [Saprospiraceae bacterium]
MKKLIILLLSLCFIMSKCPDDTPKLEELPPITQTGEGTFGCLVNGKVWIPSKWHISTSPRYVGVDTFLSNTMKINMTRRRDTSRSNITLIVKYKNFSVGNQSYFANLSYYNDTQVCDYNTFEIDTTVSPNFLKVNFVDTSRQRRVMAGEFQARFINKSCKDTINITQGRFDMPFTIE